MLLFLSSFGNLSANHSPMTNTAGEVPLPGADTFIEFFSDTTHANLTATTAAHWGDGFIETPRDIAGLFGQLDYYATASPVRSVDVQDQKAYITLYDGSADTIKCLDITDPANIAEHSGLDSFDYLLSGEVEGDMFFAGVQNRTGQLGRIAFYNVSKYNALGGSGVYLTENITNGDVTDFQVQGHYLYTTIYDDPTVVGYTLRIIDIKNVTNPVQIGGDMPYQALGLAVDGKWAYVANGIWGISYFNVSDPYATSHKYTRNTVGNATDILVDGSIGYVANGISGVAVLDLSSPIIPVIGSIDTPGNAERLALLGDCLVVADRSGGARIIDVSNPYVPRFVASCNVDAYDVAFYGDTLVIGASDGVYTWQVGEFSSLSHVGTYSGYEAWDVRVRGDVAYVAAGSDGLLTLDVSDPSSPVLLDRNFSIANFYRKLDVQGQIAVVADYGNGIHVFDVSSPGNIQFLNSCSLSYATDVFISGEVVYVADGTDGVCIYNISNPNDIPSQITSFSGLGNVTAVWVQGYHLYVASQVSSGTPLSIYDITNISSPSQVFAWNPFSAGMYDIYVDGDVAYTTDTGSISSFLEIWNVTDPFNTYYSDNIGPTSEECLGVWGFGPYFITANYSAGVGLYDGSDINNLEYLSSYAAANRAVHLTVQGEYVYVANRNSLVILQFFRSAADFFELSSNATSLEIDSTDRVITSGTLTYVGEIPSGTSVDWQLSADGGSNWESVTPSVAHPFTNRGNDLRWRAILTSSSDDRSPLILSLSIDYTYNELAYPPLLDDPGVTDDDGAFSLSWSKPTDDGLIVSYLIQMSNSNSFAYIIEQATPTDTSESVAGLPNGTYYFRVCALDNDGEYGYWSNTESITVAIPPATTTSPPPLPPDLTPLIIGLAVVVIVLVIVLLFYFLYFRKRK